MIRAIFVVLNFVAAIAILLYVGVDTAQVLWPQAPEALATQSIAAR